jgi:hypothetical protein
MSTLVTGIFQAEDQARQAVRHLIKSCVPMDLVRTILPGMRLRLAAHQADGGHAPKEPGTVMVAVKAPEYVAQRLAVKILREHGARDIECVSAPQPMAAPRQSTNPRLRIRISVRNAPAHAPVPVW